MGGYNPISQRNSKAITNGQIGEKYVFKQFDNVKVLNGIVDAVIGNKLTEIKTCQAWQKNGVKRCRGRFVLEESQHKYLVENNGFYLFIVLNEDFKPILKFWIKASAIHFKRKIMWTNLLRFLKLEEFEEVV